MQSAVVSPLAVAARAPLRPEGPCIVATSIALPKPRHRRDDVGGMERRSGAFLEVATELAVEVVRKVLGESGLDAREIGYLVTTTVTGADGPSLDARIVGRVGLSPSVRRVPLFGLGCLGGAVGLARASEYLAAFPDEAAILVSVELCSLPFQLGDPSMANVISSELFGERASAVLLVGARHPVATRRARPRVVASRSVFFADAERAMGRDTIDSGFNVVVSAGVSDIACRRIPLEVDAFLASHGLDRARVASWIVHPGDPRVVDALQQGLELPEDALRPTRDGLARYGVHSSSSVLFLLDEHRRKFTRPAGAHGLLMAMGPARCAELLLLGW